MSSLPEDSAQAFVEYEDQAMARALYESQENPTDAKRRYVFSMLAFVHEFDMDIDLPEKVPLTHSEFCEFYELFQAKVQYWKERFKLRGVRRHQSSPVTVTLSFEYREEIHVHIDKIRKIVSVAELPENKKDRILGHLNALSREIDLEKTGTAAFTRSFLAIMEAIGDGAEKLEPAVRQIERIAKILGRAPEADQKLLTNQKKIEFQGSGDDKKDFEDEEIPF
jgi:hypothetical protein